MRNFINLVENNVYDEFSTKGKADVRVRRNDPRFSDNPLIAHPEDEYLAEFDGSSEVGTAMIDRLHDAFKKGDISDQEIKQGVQLTPEGMQRVSAAFGIGPDELEILLASLTQHLRDASQEDVIESYDRFMEDGGPENPFDDQADDGYRSAESDYLGDVTVRSSDTGHEKFFQGSQAANIAAELKAAGNNKVKKQQVLKPLVEDDELDDSSFADEIASDNGTYNFPWEYQGQTGFGTMFYGVRDGKPRMRLISVRAGDEEIEPDLDMKHELLAQARRFIPDA